MILCDTNILIHAFNGNISTIEALEDIGFENIVLSSVTTMELLQGMGNKIELAQMKKKIKYYDIIHFDINISQKSIELIERFKLSHHLQIPDAIIGATAIVNRIELSTYNKKDFDFMPNIILY
ncbi:type II toxin-antitoxin system VapC family toxin [Pedobacter jejuensis]|uniref:Type II toxin-antitoxin system VapC family toxin n=1 Tax=Pedobacter jejuensis TaxID=1268550 RepID=A0A3N0BNA5_9SPHI|nr:type II toxin-antitoxin system VapC family toxin [Pedobacter jejuensis]RNL50227.1 type II toxin-antitoxin system VapC family toxin [Pedobacter jejuensis]